MEESFGKMEQTPTPIKKLMDYFPAGSTEELNLSDVPRDVLEHFEKKSSLYIPREDYRPGNFHTVLSLEKAPSEKTYLAMQIKKYDMKNPDTNTEELTYLVDTSKDKITGYSEIRFSTSKESDYFKNKPFVGFTRTYDEFLGKNLGTERLKTMNDICLALYGTPIYSDTIIIGPANRVWEKLVERGEAEKFKEGKYDRYRFLSPGKQK